MRMVICTAAFLSLAGLLAEASDLAAGGGVGPAPGNSRTDPSGKDASPRIGGTFLLNGGFDLFRFGGVAAGIEVPLALYGSRASDTFATGGYASIYTERLNAVLTPGLRLRLAAGARFSPWVSFGAGVAVVHRTGNDFGLGQPAASQVGSSRVPALAPAAGADCRLARGWFLRAELRNYLHQTPATGFVSSFSHWNRWNFHPVAAASLGYRWR